MGICLTVMSACVLLSLRFPVLPLFLPVLVVCFVVMLWRIIRRMASEERTYYKFSALWLCGIYTVIFGTLICSLFSGIYLTLIDPGFVHNYVASAVETIEQSPQASEYASTTEVLHRALDARMFPGGMQFVATMGWLTCFGGSILSMLISAVIIITKPSQGERWGRRVM